MNWIMFVGIALAIVLVRWDKKDFHFTSYLKEILVLGIFIYLLSSIGEYITSRSNISFSLSNYISKTLQVLIGSIIIFSFACMISVMGWKDFNYRKQSTGEK